MNMDFALRDVSDDHTETVSGSVKVEKDGLALLIGVQGYGEMTAEDGQAHPILLERFHGKLRLIVWGDINEENPTHIIDLEPAREDARLLDPDGDFTVGELREYVKQRRARCIKCGSDDLRCTDYGRFDIVQDDLVFRSVHCNKCGREWRDELKLTGVTE